MSGARPKAAPRERGFTLLEILVAVALSAVVFTALYSSYFAAHRAVEAADGALVSGREARGAVDGARREIEAAVFSRDKGYTAFRIEDRDFYGAQASRLTFTAFIAARPGLSLVEYAAFFESGRMDLKKRVSGPFGAPRAGWSVIAEGIDSFTVEALGKDGWVRSWDSSLLEDPATAVPYEVRVVVVYGGGRASVSDTARPRAGRPAP